MDIEQVRDNLRQIDSPNIIRLLSDVILHNIDKITTFSTTDMYYKDDVVYIYDDTSGKHSLYICTEQVVQPGAFDATKWDEYKFNFRDKKIILESEYKATADGISKCPINQSLFDFQRDELQVFHSLRGRLRKGTDWALNADKVSIDLKGFTLYKNESLLFETTK